MRAIAWAIGILLCGVLLAGCPHDVKTVDELKGLKGNWAKMSQVEVTCTAAEEACVQARLLKGDGCLQYAKELDKAHAQAAQIRQHYECAVQNLGTGVDLSGGRDPASGPLQPYAEELLEALRQRQDLAASNQESAPYTQALQQRATQYRQRHASDPAGYFYGAIALQTQAGNAGQGAAACPLLQEAIGLAKQGRTHPGRYDDALRGVQAELMLASQGNRCSP